MLHERSKAREIIDDLAFSDPNLSKNLQEMAQLNKWLKYNESIIKALHKIIKKYPSLFNRQKRSIVDFGCGCGDALRVIDDWNNGKLDLELIGIDANIEVLDYAKKSSITYPNIIYIQNVILKKEYDIVMLNHLCHHLDNPSLINLLKELHHTTRIAIIINDLHRHIIAYIGIKLITKFFNFCDITKHDGPLSVLKGFVKHEFLEILKLAKISRFEMTWIWPFRWQIIIWCSKRNLQISC